VQRFITFAVRAACASAVLLFLLALAAGRAGACENDRADHRWRHDHDHVQPGELRDQPDATTVDGDDNDGDDFDRTATQEADTATEGVAVADTGGNVAIASPTKTATAATKPPKPGIAKATVGASSSAIAQLAKARARDAAAVDILQLALVVNVGESHAASGVNVTPPVEPVRPAIETGDATAIGQAATTGIAQRAVITRGAKSNQTATVVNVGVGIANTGLNVALTPGRAGTATTEAVARPGSALAVGNVTWTTIEQRAGGTATGTARLTIEQRAAVLNVGVAFANSGGNVVVSGRPNAPTTEPITTALWAVLAPFFQTPALPPSTGATGSISTGTAVAVGNLASTYIAQSAAGTVDGRGAARATQLAAVGNLGVAVANTGLNGSFGVAKPPDAQQPPVARAVARLLYPLTSIEWLDGPNPFLALATRYDVGDVVLDLAARYQGDEFTGSGVRVRQISGVLDVGVATADPPGAFAVSSAAYAAAAARPEDPLLRTGNATALGNRASVIECQTLNDDDAICAPSGDSARARARDEAEKNAQGGVSAKAEVNASGSAVLRLSTRVESTNNGSLASTGSDTGLMARVGLGLLGLGALLVGPRRRQRDTTSGAPTC
jgi:hypothetical protein